VRGTVVTVLDEQCTFVAGEALQLAQLHRDVSKQQARQLILVCERAWRAFFIHIVAPKVTLHFFLLKVGEGEIAADENFEPVSARD